MVSLMKSTRVIDTNPYLQDPRKLEKAICRNVESSSAIEGIEIKIKVVKGKFITTAKGPSKK